MDFNLCLPAEKIWANAHLYAYRNVEAFQYLMSHIQAALLSIEAWINSLTKVW